MDSALDVGTSLCRVYSRATESKQHCVCDNLERWHFVFALIRRSVDCIPVISDDDVSSFIVAGTYQRIGVGARPPPKKKKSGKIFFGQLLCTIRTYFRQKSCKIREFC